MFTNKEILKKLSYILSTEFEGSSVEDAIKKAKESLKVSTEELKIKVLSEGEPGLFGLKGNKPAKIKVVPNEEKIENFIKFFFIKLLNFAKDAIIYIDVTIENHEIKINAILNSSDILKNIQKKEIFNSILILTESFIEKILPNYKVILEFKVSFTSNS